MPSSNCPHFARRVFFPITRNRGCPLMAGLLPFVRWVCPFSPFFLSFMAKFKTLKVVSKQIRRGVAKKRSGKRPIVAQPWFFIHISLQFCFSATRCSRSYVSNWVSQSLIVDRLFWCDSGEWRYLLKTFPMWFCLPSVTWLPCYKVLVSVKGDKEW